jgi:hypothetical protein
MTSSNEAGRPPSTGTSALEVKLFPICRTLALVGLLLALVACGGDGGGSQHQQDGPAQVSTLAYVVTRCHEDRGGTGSSGSSGSQALWMRQGDQPPVKIAEFAVGQPPSGGFCALFGQARNGSNSALFGALGRLGVSPDGSLVVFEVTDDFSVFTHVVPEDQQGIFVVHGDGSGLHKVADHSKDAQRASFEFSPDGRRIVSTDLGPSDSGDEASQVFTLDLASGERRQVTHLPRLPECSGHSDDSPDCVQPTTPSVSFPSFLDDTTIAYTRGRGNSNIGGGLFTVKLNANDTEEPQATRVVPLPGGGVVPVFEITSAEPSATTVVMPGRTPVNGGTFVREAFVIESPDAAQRPEGRVLQLTNFGRSDTTNTRISTDRQRVLFLASANPLGTNASNQCQWFSTDRLAGDLRQLTAFGVRGEPGCNCTGAFCVPPRCTNLGESRLDLTTGSMVFSSTCDPMGTNPHDGNQLFALRPDGSGLRQLTQTQGVIRNPDRSIDVELPGPFRVPSRLR